MPVKAMWSSQEDEPPCRLETKFRMSGSAIWRFSDWNSYLAYAGGVFRSPATAIGMLGKSLVRFSTKNLSSAWHSGSSVGRE